MFINEFWTSKQRAASGLHEISYRACFKPQLPRFFIERLTSAQDYLIYDPFLGRGTTLIEAALLIGALQDATSTRLAQFSLHPAFVRRRFEKFESN